jgi:hypothetical protein
MSTIRAEGEAEPPLCQKMPKMPTASQKTPKMPPVSQEIPAMSQISAASQELPVSSLIMPRMPPQDPTPPLSSSQLIEQGLSGISQWEGFVYAQGQYKILERAKAKASLHPITQSSLAKEKYLDVCL